MYNVLIVDDELAVFRGLENILCWEEFGLEIVAKAKNGRTALDAISKHEIDLLITDIRMPGMSGIELIKKVTEIQPKIYTIILSAHDEFEYVKEALQLGVENYLLKPLNRKELSSTLEKTIENMNREKSQRLNYHGDIQNFRENLLNRWVNGTIENYELTERAELAQLNLTAHEYVVVIIRIIADDDLPEPSAICDLHNILKQSFQNRFTEYNFINSVNQIIMLFYGKNLQEQIGTIREMIGRCLTRFAEKAKEKTFASIGKIVRTSREAHESYRSAVMLQGYSFLRSSNSVIVDEPATGSVNTKLKKNNLDLVKLELLIRTGDIKESCEFIKGIISRINTDVHSLQQAKAALLELIFYIIMPIHDVIDHNKNLPEAFKLLLSEFENVSTYEALLSCLTTVVTKAIEYIHRREELLSPLIQYIVKEIQDNYATPMSLKTLAAKYRISPSYLGQLFRNETGELFTTYINKIRMENAEELIRTTSHKMNEIAMLTGYENISYFHRIFKNTYGISPAEYQRKIITLDN
ncbi:MAG: response regulator transcription factor [Spirochaetales bacterium]|nr:response regulator transcription factor [Spirochaetales bacterium]